MEQSILVKNQKQQHVFSDILINGVKSDLIVNIRYDDNCGNGHNSFSITGDVYEANKRSDAAMIMSGCIHDVIAKHAPQFKHLIKWHLCSSDKSMHYIDNTLYHARTVDTKGFKVGEAIKFNTRLKFSNSFFTFDEQSKNFWEYLNSVGDFNNIFIEPINYDGAGGYDFECNYSLTGFIKEHEINTWHKAPFKNKHSAIEFLNALKSNDFEYVKIPIQWCKSIKPNLMAARNSAIWSKAKLSDLTEEKLNARLPNLMNEFKNTIESLGMVY